MKKITNALLAGYENTKYYHYLEIGEEFPNSIYYDELPTREVKGVLKANRYVNGRLLQVYSEHENHVGVIAATRQGKTTSYVVPTIMSFANAKNKRSMIITDPKGEVYRQTAASLKELGYDVLLLNFRDYENSECWNPLTPIYRKFHTAYDLDSEVNHTFQNNKSQYEFRGKTFENIKDLEYELDLRKSAILADVSNDIEGLTLLAAPTENSKDPFWDNAARDLFKAFLWAMLEDSIPENIIGTERTLITEDTYSFKTLIALTSVLNDRSFTSYDDTKYECYYFSQRPNTSTARQIADSVIPVSARTTRSCIFTIFTQKLNTFSEISMRIVTSCNSFDLKEKLISEEPVAIFINFRDELKVHFKMISLFVQDAYRILIEDANDRKDGKRKVPFYFILDEFGNCPKMTDFETTISACAGRNIFFILIIQSYAQLDNIYGKEVSEIIRDNLNMHIFFGSNNTPTLKAFSEECGKVTRIAPSSALNGSAVEMDHYVHETIDLVPVSALRYFEAGECIITEANCGYVMYSRLERFYLCKEFNNLPLSDVRTYKGPVNPFDPRYTYVLKSKKNDDFSSKFGHRIF